MEQRELEKTSTGDYVFQKGDAPKKNEKKTKKEIINIYKNVFLDG